MRSWRPCAPEPLSHSALSASINDLLVKPLFRQACAAARQQAQPQTLPAAECTVTHRPEGSREGKLAKK
jgi:hypothetical protein